MRAKFANNASSKLTGALTAVATSFSVTAGEGAKFPALTDPTDWFMLTLVKLVSGVPTYEIIKVTARATDTFTVVRAQEGTTATTFSAGDVVELRATAGTLDNFLQVGDTSGSTDLAAVYAAVLAL